MILYCILLYILDLLLGSVSFRLFAIAVIQFSCFRAVKYEFQDLHDKHLDKKYQVYIHIKVSLKKSQFCCLLCFCINQRK